MLHYLFRVSYHGYLSRDTFGDLLSCLPITHHVLYLHIQCVNPMGIPEYYMC